MKWLYKLFGIKLYRICYETTGPYSGKIYTFKMSGANREFDARYIMSKMQVMFPDTKFFLEEVEY